MSSSYGRLAAIRDYWMPRNLDARVEVRVTDIDEILRELVRVTTLAAERAAPPPPVQHSDDVAVDRFAAVMKAKLAQKRAEGYGGWDDPEQCPVERLAELLHKHVSKGDPIDVANFAMMLHCRGGRTTPPVQQDDEALEVLRLALDALVESVDQVQHDYDTDWRHNIPTRASQLQRSLDALTAHKTAIDRIRALLAKRGAA